MADERTMERTTMRWTLALVTLAVALGLSGPRADEEAMKYPPTRRVEQADDYHGTKVRDPYRWLEEDVRKSKDVAAWVEAQNKITFSFLERIPQRQAIQRRLTRLWDYERYSAPFKVAGRYFYYR